MLTSTCRGVLPMPIKSTTYCLIVVAGLLGFSWGICQESQGPEQAAYNTHQGAINTDAGVRVGLFERNVLEKSWDFQVDEPYLEYSEPAFLLVGTPKKYAPGGIIAAQPNPFLLRASAQVTLPPGRYQFLLRAKNAARLHFGDQLVAKTDWMSRNASGHERVPDLIPPRAPGMWLCPPSYQEVISEAIQFDGTPLEVRLEAIVGGKGLRPELGELVVAWCRAECPQDGFFILAPSNSSIPFTEAERSRLLAQAESRRISIETTTRRQLSQTDDHYWARRHELARQKTGNPSFLPVSLPAWVSQNEALDYLLERGSDANELAPACSDTVFLRRLYLDLVGVIPTAVEMEEFFRQPESSRRAWLVDRLLGDPRWADAWVPFWQDLLAENPGILKPELNNTGPFRFWIYESFLDNKPLDRFVTELVLMQGGKFEGGPAGFSMATQNDVPMAAKAHVLAEAFLAIDLGCARCHDSPLQPYRQRELFQLAAMLEGKPIVVPATSSVPASVGGRTPAVNVTLHPGDQVDPHWPWAFPSEMGDLLPDEMSSPRHQVALMLTSPANERFAQVFVNRVWHRYMGWALVTPLDDWYSLQSDFPEVLNFLARDFIGHRYDVKHLARRIVLSRAYQRCLADTAQQAREWRAPLRRRMSAEQIVDSIFLAMGKSLGAEEITMDQEGRRPYETFLNLGTPRRAWQLAGLSNERDRPALALPVAQALVDLLVAFHWRESRPNPVSQRDNSSQLLQPLTLANGVAVHRAVRLSDETPWVDIALEAQTPQELARRLFRAVLTRDPTVEELATVEPILQEGFMQRATGLPRAPLCYDRRLPQRVSWSNHLSPEATELKMQWEQIVRQGGPPTARLHSDWRERCEDVLWALFNSPEFVFIP